MCMLKHLVVVETVNIHVGESFTGNPAATISIVNPDGIESSSGSPREIILPVQEKATSRHRDPGFK